MQIDEQYSNVKRAPFFYHRLGVLCEKCGNPYSRMIKYEWKDDGFNKDGTKKYRMQFAWISTTCKCIGPGSFVMIYRDGRPILRDAKDYIKDYNRYKVAYKPGQRVALPEMYRRKLGVLDYEPRG